MSGFIDVIEGQKKDARLAELKAENKRGSATIASYIRQVADIREQLGCPQDRHVGMFAKETRRRAEQAEADLVALREHDDVTASVPTAIRHDGTKGRRP